MKSSRVLILGLAGVVVLGLYFVLKVPTVFPLTTVQAWRYGQIVGPRSEDSLLKHFPKAIPSEATRMRFYFHPGYLQAGTVYQLRLQLPPSAIEELEKRFSQAKTSSLWGGEGKLSAVDGRPVSAFYTNDEWESEEGQLFPPDYEIMILDPLLPESQRSGGAQWNHGESHGVAISKQRNEIVYWAQEW